MTLATKNAGEGQFLIDANQIAAASGIDLIKIGTSPSWFDDGKWQGWWQDLPKAAVGDYAVRFSPRANRTNALLDEAKAGLLFGDVTRYGHIVRVREVLLKGHHMQPLSDRGAFAWSLFACDNDDGAQRAIDGCLKQLTELAIPKDIGRYLEACDLLNRQPLDNWGFCEYYRIAYSYFMERGEVEDWDPADKVPTIEQLRKAVADLDVAQAKLLEGDSGEGLTSLVEKILDAVGSPDTLDLRKKPHQPLATFR